MKNPLRILVVAASLAIAAPLYAQGGGGGGGGGQQMTPEQRLARTKEMLFAGITLTPEQNTKIDTILVQASRKQQEARAAGLDPRSPEGQAKMAEYTAERTKLIKAVLTAEQNPIFDKNLAADAGRSRPGRILSTAPDTALAGSEGPTGTPHGVPVDVSGPVAIACQHRTRLRDWGIAMPNHPEDDPRLRAPTPAPDARPRCPRCGSRTGALDVTPVAADDAGSGDRYCGCCGLIVSIAR